MAERADYKIEVFKGKGAHPWFWRLVSVSNGQTLAVSEGYLRRADRTRIANKLMKALNGGCSCLFENLDGV